MIKFLNEDNKEAMIKAFELVPYEDNQFIKICARLNVAVRR